MIRLCEKMQTVTPTMLMKEICSKVAHTFLTFENY
jgi:hypothetical protein